MDFDRVDVNDFGYLFNDDVSRPAFEQGIGNLNSACDRAEKDVSLRQIILRHKGIGMFENDAEWRRLNAKAQRLKELRQAAHHKIDMDKAKTEAGLEDGPTVCNVTEAICGQKKAAADAAEADWKNAKNNAVDVGLDLPDVKANVDYLADQATLAKAEYDVAVKQLAYNKKRAGLVAAYEGMHASARKLCAAGSEGDRLCLGLLLKVDNCSFKSVGEGYLEASYDLRGPTLYLETIMAKVGRASAVSQASAQSSTPTAAAPSSTASDAGLAASAATFTSADGLLPSSSSGSGSGLQAAVVEQYAASRQTTTSRTAVGTNGNGRITWIETSVTQVNEVITAARLHQITMSWDNVFASARAVRQEMTLPACMDSASGDDELEESVVLHIALVRSVVSAIHIRLLLAYLGHPAVVWVKRGFSDRRGQREDFAWVRFRTLAEAVDCKWRWDGMGHWGLTPWYEYYDQPRPLHFSFSTHPAYKGKKH